MIVTNERYHDFSAGHRVCGHENVCAHLHGHNYRVFFTCTGQLDNVGRIIDFSVIKSTLCQWLEDNWDHRMILWEDDPWLEALQLIDSDVTTLPMVPTAENMAHYLLDHVGPIALKDHPTVKLIAVRVEETRKCSATAERK
jgi:6-pyruvoyltetrahydropterin/6-carboxytetrahydropterin synthase